MDSNFTFVLPVLYLRRCVKFVVILPLGSGYALFSKPFGKSVNLPNPCHVKDRRLNESFQVWYKDSASINLTNSSKNEHRTDLRADRS